MELEVERAVGEEQWKEQLMDSLETIDHKIEVCADVAFGASEHAKAVRRDWGLDIVADVAVEAAEEAWRLYDRASEHWETSDAVLTFVERQAINAFDDAADLAVVASVEEAATTAVSVELVKGGYDTVKID
eukprot:7067858-Prymnesium_polylepis.2